MGIDLHGELWFSVEGKYLAALNKQRVLVVI